MRSSIFKTVIRISLFVFGTAGLSGAIAEDGQKIFSLEKDFVLDTEADSLVEFGIRGIRDFDVDSQGNIYIFNGSEPSILCFDDKGIYIKSIGRAGQGPGEIGQISSLRITEAGHISMHDFMNRKFLIYGTDGNVVEEIKCSARVSILDACYMGSGRILVLEKRITPEEKSIVHSLALFDRDFSKLCSIDGEVSRPNPIEAARYDLMEYALHFYVQSNRIYVANSQEEEFEIELFDLDGQLVRKVADKLARVKVSDDYKNDLIARIGHGPMWDMVKDKAYFPEYFPPLKAFYVDGKGKILVESYRTDPDKSRTEVDIFSAEGQHIGIVDIPVHKGAVFRNGRFYLVIVKENGYSKLEVYKLDEG